MATPSAATASPTTSLIENIDPQTLATAGVPFALARWYHLVGCRLTRFSEWDIDRIMKVRLQLALSGF